MPDQNAVVVKLPGQKVSQPSLPRALQPGLRSGVTGAEDPFLPAGMVKVVEAYDLSRSARSAAGDGIEGSIDPGHVVALELPDGVTLFIRADKLRADLERADPDAVKDGKVDIGKIRDRGVASRSLLTDLVSKVFVLDVGPDAIIEAAKRKAAEWLGRDAGELGASWIGTKALMWAIESRLSPGPGLYRWIHDDGELHAVDALELERESKTGPLLVLIHGTGSSSQGSFSDLRSAGGGGDWKTLRQKFGDRIFAFEHRTMSESPIENALALARALPKEARVNLVTHSRGGLVGDLLCLDGLDEKLINNFRRSGKDFERADQEDREGLRELATALGRKNFQIERYVRVACPARGTRLASANFDVFLSGLLSLAGAVPALAGNPIYSALKRIVIEIARNRTRPNLVPGIEAMLPESPVGEFLIKAKVKTGAGVAVIAGDIEGGGFLKRLGLLLTDHIIFDSLDNDLVVDTDSMYAGVARPGQAKGRFEQGPRVNHFRYFVNDASRGALRNWLTAKDTALVEGFEPLSPPPAEHRIPDRARDASRSLTRPESLPVAVVIPGIMGSHLTAGTKPNRVWFDPLDLAVGGLRKIALQPGDGVAPEDLFEMFYGDLCRHLEMSHRVVRFPYDWRKAVSHSGEELAKRLRILLEETKQPIRILGHSMGGLVTRAMVAHDPKLWDELMRRDGSRFVMLGTPNRGSHSMVETLLGKGDSLRNLARLDQRNNLQQLLDIVSGFHGALQLLPDPNFIDAAGQPARNYYDAGLWQSYRDKVKDFWFGDGVAGQPSQSALDEAVSFWKKPPELPSSHKDKVVYVFGMAPNTPCGIREEGGRLKMLGTAQGDGTVTWESGEIDGIGQLYSLGARHGELADTREYFPALVDLLSEGKTSRLPAGRPAARGAGSEIVTYDAGPVLYPTAEEAGRALLGAKPRKPTAKTAVPTLEVSCKAGDLRFVTQPILVGHYEQDPISGAEALIDRDLVGGNLTLRHHLGLYAGPVGTATVVLLPQNQQEQERRTYRGAVVTGLGKYGDLTTTSLEEAVRAGALRYLLHLVDSEAGQQGGQAELEVGMSSLLVGYNSTTNISIEDSVMAVVRGVLQANQQFAESMKARRVRIATIEILELYLDTAIGAARALHTVAARLNADAGKLGARIDAAAELRHGDGVRPRLDAMGGSAYWPRLMVTDAEQPDPERTSDSASDRARLQPSEPKRYADKLRFVYLGQRARAETVIQQRQPGLVEKLVEESIRDQNYKKDFAHTLFQLLVPHDFKEAARQMERMSLVVDGYTANLPWEMMQDNETPLAVRIAMVRQLASGRFRSRVRQTLEPSAYVIGNPSTAGFGEAFPGAAGNNPESLSPLPGAEKEALAVAALLKQSGYQVAEAIGGEQRAVDIINGLYRQPYRIVHIAAHGIYDLKAVDGKTRSGVVLSSGLLITAAEIGSMEVVPDLVFLNCCHLGKTGSEQVAFNRLAYSVSRELIEIGVRAVVAAGWAVDDQAATLFAEVLYRHLITGNMPFGRSVLEARREVYDKFGSTNTWGAYQAYGDPGFVMDPRPGRATTGLAANQKYFSPEELLDQLGSRIANVSRQGTVPSAVEAEQLAREIDDLLRSCPDKWALMPFVNSELGRFYAELGPGKFAQARKCYLAAIRAEDKAGRVPIKAIEQLANLEAREGEASGNSKLIDAAIRRLSTLEDLVSDAEDGKSPGQNHERLALMGSAYKRKAGLFAARDDFEEFDEALAQSISYYRLAEGKLDEPGFRTYSALNRLSLEAVTKFGQAAKDDQILAQKCGERAREAYRNSSDFWDAVTSADADLAGGLLSGTLGSAGAQGDKEAGQLSKAYVEVVSVAQIRPKNLDSVVSHVCLLSLFFAAKAKRLKGPRAGQAKIIAERLKELAEQILPGATERGRAKEQAKQAPPKRARKTVARKK